MEKNQVPASWFVDVLKLGVAKAYGSDLDTDPLAWQEDALCAQTDPEASSQKKVAQPEMRKESVHSAPFAQSASNTH